MPLHVFISQSASLLTGGLDIWKAAKDIILFALVPIMIYVSFKKGLFRHKSFRNIVILGGAYAFIHLLFVLFDKNDDTYSAIVASVYNTRLFGFLLLGYLSVSLNKSPKRHLRILLTTAVLISTLVAVFGVMQYFLPHNLLESVGYSLDRGVKPLFFIDDRPELPRIMSTLKDPNSLGAYLVLPTLALGYSLKEKAANLALFVRTFRPSALTVMFLVHIIALWLTFSRGALLSLIIAGATLVYLSNQEIFARTIKKYWIVILCIGLLVIGATYAARNSSFVQDYVLHAAVSSEEQDPNEKRIGLQQEALEDISENPLGEGPGSAGLVAINNPQGGVLTENYYLQIAYEVGLFGLGIFLAALYTLIRLLQKTCNKDNEAGHAARLILASLIGYCFYSLLIHLWSNEAVVLQWWLLCGATLGILAKQKIRLN